MYFLFNVRLLKSYDWKTRLSGLSYLLLKVQMWRSLLSCTMQSKIGFYNKLLMWPMSLNTYSNIYYYSKFHDSCSTRLKNNETTLVNLYIHGMFSKIPRWLTHNFPISLIYDYNWTFNYENTQNSITSPLRF